MRLRYHNVTIIIILTGPLHHFSFHRNFIVHICSHKLCRHQTNSNKLRLVTDANFKTINIEYTDSPWSNHLFDSIDVKRNSVLPMHSASFEYIYQKSAVNCCSTRARRWVKYRVFPCLKTVCRSKVISSHIHPTKRWAVESIQILRQ